MTRAAELRSRLRRNGWAIGVLCLAGCEPEIMAFDVQPRRACAGDTVHLSWKVRGTPQVLASRLTTDSSDIIRYTLVSASRGKQVESSLDVVTFSPGASTVLAAGTTMRGADSLEARDSARAEVWHSLVQVGQVISDSGRELRVRHGGREAVVGPGRGPSTEWRGLPLGGEWEILTALNRGEVPGHRTRSPPARLFLRVNLMCAGAAGQPPA